MRYIILSTIIFLLSCTQSSLIDSVQNMENFGLNMGCKITAKYEDKLFIKIYCFDLDEDGKVVLSDYWKEAIQKNASIRVLFIDADGFERYEHEITATSFTKIVDGGDIQFQGTINTQLLPKEVFDKVSKLRLGTKGLGEMAKY